jgi:hypothetical protein
MSSNEHPDMSGNPCDMPLSCDMCGCDVREDRMYGSKHNEDAVLCSDDCACDYDEREDSKHQ